MKISKVKQTFFAGMLTAAPLLVTFIIIRAIVRFIEEGLNPSIERLLALLQLSHTFENALSRFLAPFISVAIGLASIYLLGVIGSNVFGKQILRLFERLLLHIPVIRGIYSTMRQLTDTFSQSSTNTARKVAYVRFPHAHTWTLGFVTNIAPLPLRQHCGTNLISVFVPTTPNPTSGFLLFVAEEDIIPCNMTVEEAVKVIISGGVATPTVR